MKDSWNLTGELFPFYFDLFSDLYFQSNLSPAPPGQVRMHMDFPWTTYTHGCKNNGKVVLVIIHNSFLEPDQTSLAANLSSNLEAERKGSYEVTMRKKQWEKREEEIRGIRGREGMREWGMREGGREWEREGGREGMREGGREEGRTRFFPFCGESNITIWQQN